MDARALGLVAIGIVVGVGLVALSRPVRELVVDVVDEVVSWWWGLVDAVNRAVAMLGALLLGALVLLGVYALVVLVLPRLAD